MIGPALFLMTSIALTACGASGGERGDVVRTDVATAPSAQPPTNRHVVCDGRNTVGATMDYVPKGLEPRVGSPEPAPNRTPLQAVRAWDEVDDETTVYVEHDADRATAFLVRQDGSVSARLELRGGQEGWFLDAFEACPSATPWQAQAERFGLAHEERHCAFHASRRPLVCSFAPRRTSAVALVAARRTR